MLRCGTAGAGFEHAAACHQWNDRQHLRAGAQLHDREQVGQVVAQHIAGNRNRVLAGTNPVERETGRFDRRHDADIQTARVVILQILLDLPDDLGVVRASRVQPEHSGRMRGACAVDGEFDPVLNRRVLRLAHAPDVARFDRLLEQHLAGRIDYPNHAVRLNLERLVV